MQPERLLVPTCVGCGAMAIPGTCQGGCTEVRLDLVGADAFDEVEAEGAASRAAAEAFRPIAEELARSATPPVGWEPTYRRLQHAARAALRAHPDRLTAEQPALEVTTWSCPACGGLDAPQPCLGICVWRPVEWVSRGDWEEAQERARVGRDSEAALRRVLRQIAFITPRENQWRSGWEALSQAARQTLASTDRR